MEENEDTFAQFTDLSHASLVQKFVDECDSFNEIYDIVKKIGEGDYGTVFSARSKGKHKTFPELVALKIMEESRFEDTEIDSNLKLLKGDHCKNLVRFIHLNNLKFKNKKFYIVVMEFCEGGTLEKSEFQEKYGEYEFQLHILEDLIEGLMFMHSLNLVHHDIHRGNIYFRSDSSVVYGDFGLTKEEASYTKYDDIERLADTLIRVVFKITTTGSLNINDIKQRLKQKDVSESLIDVLAGLRERTMDLKTAKDKIGEMKRKLQRKEDDRTTVPAPEAPCSSSRPCVRRRESNEEDGTHNHIQKCRKIDEAQKELKVNGDEILFDYLSRKLAGSSPSEFCVILLDDSTVVGSCKGKYDHKIFFKIMNGLNHVEELKKTLSKLGREDLVELIRTFSIESFQVHTNAIEEPTLRVVEDDFRRISRNLADTYVHVVRYLGLRQKDIDQLESNFPCDIKTQIFEAFKLVKHNFPSLNRKHVCDALHYADQVDVIVLLNKEWVKD